MAQTIYVSTTGDPECKELGYHKLESGSSVTISTYSSFKYYRYDSCEFSFYAPGAKGIQYEIDNFDVCFLFSLFIIRQN